MHRREEWMIKNRESVRECEEYMVHYMEEIANPRSARVKKNTFNKGTDASVLFNVNNNDF